MEVNYIVLVTAQPSNYPLLGEGNFCIIVSGQGLVLEGVLCGWNNSQYNDSEYCS